MYDERPNRPPALSIGIVVFALALWSISVGFIFHNVLNWPYMGAEFSADYAGQSAKVDQIRNNSVASRSGMTVGDEIIAMRYADGQRYEMMGLEAFEGREQLHSYEMVDQAVAAKLAMWEILNSGPVTFEMRGGKEVTLTPENGRSIFTLPPRVFNFMLQSLVVLMIAAGILAFAPTTLPVGLLVTSGVGMTVNMLFNVVAYSGEMTLPPDFVQFGMVLTPLANLTFSGCLLALIWHFPSRISRFPFGLLVLAFLTFVFTAQQFHYAEFPIHPFQGPALVMMSTAIVVSILSWRKTRDRPLQRASVMWFMLSIVGVTGFVTLFYNVPAAFGQPPILNTNFALLAITVLYIGVAFGTLRFRLFDIQRIWWRTITWAVGGLVVVAVDILLISQFDFEQKAALPMALLIAGWGYFPIRQFIFERFIRADQLQVSDYIPKLINHFSGLDDIEEFDGRHAGFMRDVFQAQELGAVGMDRIDKARIEDNGLCLRVPDVSGNRSIALIGRNQGRALFSLSDVKAADTLTGLVRYMGEASRREFDRLQTDRQQIVRDLHDDVGGRLLSLIYNAPNDQFSTDARDALASLKESLVVIEDTQTVDASAGWERIREDAAHRLGEAGFELEATSNLDSDRILNAREFMNLRRIVQEIVSNIIKYGKPGKVLFSFSVDDEGTVRFHSCNSIGQLDEGTFSTNRGLSNIRTRLSEIGGDLVIEIDDAVEQQDYRMDITLPLQE